ncbi:uncharacterized protein FLJ37310-like [Pezoporus flaviventris]|uniref:uncharacterized protein FLJ37310-like n=1 Tax=Pezoporus flaviventris TaxID=889875 RepID=UPI002AAFF88F|nr:uncharacterized protein FLJ37310-like [Pezoporus flaviventris]
MNAFQMGSARLSVLGLVASLGRAPRRQRRSHRSERLPEPPRLCRGQSGSSSPGAGGEALTGSCRFPPHPTPALAARRGGWPGSAGAGWVGSALAEVMESPFPLAEAGMAAGSGAAVLARRMETARAGAASSPNLAPQGGGCGEGAGLVLAAAGAAFPGKEELIPARC